MGDNRSAHRTRGYVDPFKFVDSDTDSPDDQPPDVEPSGDEREMSSLGSNVDVFDADLDPNQPDQSESSTDELTSSFVVVYEATNLSDIGVLERDSDRKSEYHMVSRGRSSGVPIDTDVDAGSEYEMSFHDTHLPSDTGYVMRFVHEDLLDFSVFDIISIPDLASYPVSSRTLKSIPPEAYGKLQDQGYIKFSAIYDESSKQFYSFELGWQPLNLNQADVLLHLLEQFDKGQLAKPVYFFLSEYASDRNARPEKIAETRGVQKSTVESEVDNASEEIDSSSLPM